MTPEMANLPEVQVPPPPVEIVAPDAHPLAWMAAGAVLVSLLHWLPAWWSATADRDEALAALGRSLAAEQRMRTIVEVCVEQQERWDGRQGLAPSTSETQETRPQRPSARRLVQP